MLSLNKRPVEKGRESARLTCQQLVARLNDELHGDNAAARVFRQAARGKLSMIQKGFQPPTLAPRTDFLANSDGRSLTQTHVPVSVLSRFTLSRELSHQQPTKR
jgi:hypothetical protein